MLVTEPREPKPFTPDFTVYCTERVIYMRITFDNYNNAINQSALQSNTIKPGDGTPDSPGPNELSITVMQHPISTHKAQPPEPSLSNPAVINNNIKTNAEFEMRDLNGGKQTPTDENSKLI